VKLEKKKGAPEIANYRDAFKDPYLLDFLGLTGAYSEKDLEAAIITNLQQFLTELGSDFCFIRRQYPMRIDDEDYFLDLLFYHRVLRCLVAVDLLCGRPHNRSSVADFIMWRSFNLPRPDRENEHFFAT
jgi:predicted nuclease of restriction endonuclease-like (RecB) superfamily